MQDGSDGAELYGRRRHEEADQRRRHVLTESLDGFAAAHADIVALGDGAQIRAPHASSKPGKVALISGGGSGHEPLHAGFVGHGMLDAACPGQVFTSPTPDQMLAAAEAVDSGAGVLFIVKNYEGDVHELRHGGGDGRRRDRCTVDHRRRRRGRELAPTRPGRRGVAGTLIVEKIVGAAAEEGGDLADLQGARRARQRGAPARWAWR